MSSKLEDTLLRGGALKKKIRGSLLSQLDAASLRNLRACSRSLGRLVDQDPTKLFRDIYLHAPLLPGQSLDQLKRVSMFCFRLTIKVGRNEAKKPTRFSISRRSPHFPLDPRPGEPSGMAQRRESLANTWNSLRRSISGQPAPVPSTSLPQDESPTSEQSAAQKEWTAIISSFQQLTELTIHVNGNRSWSGRTEVEQTLINLRIALELAQPYNLQIVRFTPIHAMGLIHMRWAGFGAFGSSPTTSYQLWHKLNMLDLQLRNPLLPQIELSLSQRVMFMKLLHCYLRSFSTTLTSLRFIWLDGPGPNPLALDLEPELQGGQQNAIIWKRLQKLWVGGVASPQSVIWCVRQRCSVLTSFKTLRASARDSALLFTDVGDRGAWIDVILGPQLPGPLWADGDGAVADARSSIYSQESLSRDPGEGHEDPGSSTWVAPLFSDIRRQLRREGSTVEGPAETSAPALEHLPDTVYKR